MAHLLLQPLPMLPVGQGGGGRRHDSGAHVTAIAPAAAVEAAAAAPTATGKRRRPWEVAGRPPAAEHVFQTALLAIATAPRAPPPPEPQLAAAAASPGTPPPPPQPPITHLPLTDVPASTVSAARAALYRELHSMPDTIFNLTVRTLSSVERRVRLSGGGGGAASASALSPARRRRGTASTDATAPPTDAVEVVVVPEVVVGEPRASAGDVTLRNAAARVLRAAAPALPAPRHAIHATCDLLLLRGEFAPALSLARDTLHRTAADALPDARLHAYIGYALLAQYLHRRVLRHAGTSPMHALLPHLPPYLSAVLPPDASTAAHAASAAPMWRRRRRSSTGGSGDSDWRRDGGGGGATSGGGGGVVEAEEAAWLREAVTAFEAGAAALAWDGGAAAYRPGRLPRGMLPTASMRALLTTSLGYGASAPDTVWAPHAATVVCGLAATWWETGSHKRALRACRRYWGRALCAMRPPASGGVSSRTRSRSGTMSRGSRSGSGGGGSRVGGGGGSSGQHSDSDGSDGEDAAHRATHATWADLASCYPFSPLPAPPCPSLLAVLRFAATLYAALYAARPGYLRLEGHGHPPRSRGRSASVVGSGATGAAGTPGLEVARAAARDAMTATADRSWAAPHAVPPAVSLSEWAFVAAALALAHGWPEPAMDGSTPAGAPY